MELRVLNYFVEIAKEKNISKAAEKLHLTQPTLSRQIKDLEDELGTILFIRSSRELQLTNEGQYLFNRANEILQLVNNTQEKLLAKVDYLSMSDVIKYPLIVSSQSDINYDIFADLGDYKIVATYNLLYNASLLVQAGVGIAIALDGIIHHPDLIFVPFNENTEDKLLLIWKKSSLTNSNKVFLEEVNKQIKKDN